MLGETLACHLSLNFGIKRRFIIEGWKERRPPSNWYGNEKRALMTLGFAAAWGIFYPGRAGWSKWTTSVWNLNRSARPSCASHFYLLSFLCGRVGADVRTEMRKRVPRFSGGLLLLHCDVLSCSSRDTYRFFFVESEPRKQLVKSRHMSGNNIKILLKKTF
jgi:hypothetical protein